VLHAPSCYIDIRCRIKPSPSSLERTQETQAECTAIRRTREEEGDDQRLHPPNSRDVSLPTLERCRRKIGRQAAAHSCVPGCQPRSRERGRPMVSKTLLCCHCCYCVAGRIEGGAERMQNRVYPARRLWHTSFYTAYRPTKKSGGTIVLSRTMCGQIR
jgi:hypothetical protein